MTTYQKLSQQPLVFVLAEFRFSPILEMGKYIPTLQDELRQEFPLIDTQQNQEFQISPSGIGINTTTEWVLQSKSKKQAITLNSNRLVYVTSEYDRFDGFKKQCKKALEAFIKIVNPSLWLRIGLRYNDAITKENNENIEEYVQSFLYASNSLSSVGEMNQHINEIVLETAEGCMVVRSMYAHKAPPMWPDMMLPIKIEANNHMATRIFLDFDHFWDMNLSQESDNLDFKLDDLILKLEKMHEYSRKAFWDITTDKGKSKWN